MRTQDEGVSGHLVVVRVQPSEAFSRVERFGNFGRGRLEVGGSYSPWTAGVNNMTLLLKWVQCVLFLVSYSVSENFVEDGNCF